MTGDHMLGRLAVTGAAAVGGYALFRAVESHTHRTVGQAAREFATVFGVAAREREADLREALSRLDTETEPPADARSRGGTSAAVTAEPLTPEQARALLLDPGRARAR